MKNFAAMMLGLMLMACNTSDIRESDDRAYSNPGPYQVKMQEAVWVDPDRGNREVPYRLYYPADRTGKIPVVVWSHGAGGSRSGASYLGEHLASHGFAAFHIQHPGSDAGQIGAGGTAGMLERVRDPRAVMARFGDAGFVVARIREMAANGALEGRLDADRMGMSGHSMGAISTMVAAGQQSAAVQQHFAVPHFRGAFAMSPSARGEGAEAAFSNMLMPIFHLTGTHDESPLNDFEVEARQMPFRVINNVDQVLLVLDRAVHMTFSGRSTDTDPFLAQHHDAIRTAAVAWWKMLLEGDETAKAWLLDGGFAGTLATGDKFETKWISDR